MNIRRNFLIINVFWFCLLSFSFCWSYFNAREEQENIALLTARVVFKQIVITRKWNALNGGLYAAVGHLTQPNPYLLDPNRDIRIDDSLQLTKVNPAFMTRQISEISQSEKDGLKFHITSLNPIRPENQASEIEMKLLRSFETGEKERGLFLTEDGRKVYKYMAPLLTEKPCLVCHAKQGYKEGDIRGGISVTLPFAIKVPLLSLFLSHFVIYLFGLIGFHALSRKLHESYRLIEYQAVMDSLTGIPNRHNFSETILREYKLCRNRDVALSVIMCDIDHFKKFNDHYGHMQGDACLRKVAQCIRNSLKRPGDFCARYGGEEFVVILPNSNRNGALLVTERIRAEIENLKIEHIHSTHGGVVTVSIGMVTSRDVDSESYEQLIQAADEALYSAKKSGRNQVCCYQSGN